MRSFDRSSYVQGHLACYLKLPVLPHGWLNLVAKMRAKVGALSRVVESKLPLKVFSRLHTESDK